MQELSLDCLNRLENIILLHIKLLDYSGVYFMQNQ